VVEYFEKFRTADYSWSLSAHGVTGAGLSAGRKEQPTAWPAATLGPMILELERILDRRFDGRRVFTGAGARYQAGWRDATTVAENSAALFCPSLIASPR